MYEELIEPLERILECNSYLNIDEDFLKENYGENMKDLIIHLRNDFYKTNAVEIENKFDKIKEKAENDFLTLYPNICPKVLRILLTDYLFNMR